MTKEDLCRKSITYSGYKFVSINDIEKFLELNVCIPKGDNRHPYADEIHAWAEGVSVEWRGSKEQYWRTSGFDDNEYRIKPSEPVYESQYAYDRNNGSAKISEYMTDDEAKIALVGYNYVKLDFTSKERK